MPQWDDPVDVNRSYRSEQGFLRTQLGGVTDEALSLHGRSSRGGR